MKRKKSKVQGVASNDPDDLSFFLSSTMWPDIANSAYRGYQREGRGAIVLQEDDDGWARIWYSEQVARLTGYNWPSGEAEELVSTYDPATEVALLVCRKGEWPVSYLVRCFPAGLSPQRAYYHDAEGIPIKSWKIAKGQKTTAQQP
jgi:hypothetical protein